jgi:hypothetical protein
MIYQNSDFFTGMRVMPNSDSKELAGFSLTGEHTQFPKPRQGDFLVGTCTRFGGAYHGLTGEPVIWVVWDGYDTEFATCASHIAPANSLLGLLIDKEWHS